MTVTAALAQRLRFVSFAFAFIFPIVWIAWMWPFDDTLDNSNTPAGGDFPVFYTAAQLVDQGRSRQLYDFQAQHTQLHTDFPSLRPETTLPFLYPPFVATAVRPLARISYTAALAVFLVLSTGCWGLIVLALRAHVTTFATAVGHPLTWWLFASPLLWENLLGGQLAILACAILTAGFVFLRQGRPVLAGIVLGFAAYKPNVLLFVILGIVIARPRVVIGLSIAALLLYLFGSLGAGWESFPSYVAALRSAEAHQFIANPPFEKFHGLLRTFAWMRARIPASASIACGVPLAFLIGWRWRKSRCAGADSLCVGSLVVVQALFNPYVPIYDLLQLSVGAVFVADGLVQRFGNRLEAHSLSVHVLVAAILFGPIVSEALAPATGIQIFSIALAAAAGWLAWRVRARLALE